MRIFNAIKLLSISSERGVVVKNVAARDLTLQHSLQFYIPIKNNRYEFGQTKMRGPLNPVWLSPRAFSAEIVLVLE